MNDTEALPKPTSPYKGVSELIERALSELIPGVLVFPAHKTKAGNKVFSCQMIEGQTVLNKSVHDIVAKSLPSHLRVHNVRGGYYGALVEISLVDIPAQ